MPENRKKTRSRRTHRPETSRDPDSRPGAAAPSVTANGERLVPEDDAPRIVDSAEADIAEAQMALHRDESDEVPDDDELEAFEEADARGPAVANGASGEALAPARQRRPARPAERVSGATRLVDFVRGSWRELQRVQWPDRRQVFQATGVVLGFVIVAGVFLGLADLVAEHVVKFILK